MKTPLKVLRESRRQTLQQVAESVGTDAGNLSRIENARQRASLELAEKLARHFDGELSEMQILYPSRFAKGG